MIRKLGLAVMASCMLGGAALAQNAAEKTEEVAKDAKREMKKGGHRVQEAVCTGTKAECAARKGGHRVEEAKDKAVDKADALKDKVD